MTARAALEANVKAHPFLIGMSEHHIRLLADCAMLTNFPAGKTIFAQGDTANRFYLIQQGAVVLESDAGDSPVEIDRIGDGDLLGWSWLFPPYYWHFDARALKPTSAIFLYGTRLREQCEEDHELGYQLLKRIAQVLIQRLQATRKQLLDHLSPVEKAGSVNEN